jgi:hypothetical protein
VSALTSLLGGAREVGRAITWRNVLAVQAVALLIDTIGDLIMRFPASMWISRIIIFEIVGVAIVASALLGDRLAARGMRTAVAYAIPLVLAAPLAALLEYNVRGWLGLYTLADHPGLDLAVRRTHMIYAICDVLTYGAMLIVIYLDYRRRIDLVQRVRAAELERARSDADLVQSRLAELRADVEPDELMAQLQRVRAMYDVDALRAERMLDDITDELRAKLTDPRASAAVEA